MTIRPLFRKSFIAVLVMAIVALVLYRFVFMPAPVSTVPVVKGTVVREVMGTGTLQARVRATISAKIQGRLVETLVDQNDRVTQGQLMARLDDAELQQSVEIAKAALDAASATVARVQSDLTRAKAVLDQAGKDHDRYLALKSSKSVSESDVDKSRERLAVAEADLARSEATIVEAERQVVTARERLFYEQARLADTMIIAPFGGLVIKRDREPGDVIVPGASIFQIISLREMWVSAWVDESAAAQLQEGQPARIVFSSEPDKQYQGKVVRLGREVDSETREFLVDVHVSDLPQNWAIGLRTDVYIATSNPSEGLLIPTSAVFWKEGKPSAFVVNDGYVQRREIELGVRGIRAIEVKSGLAEGEMVVTSETGASLKDGRRVSVR